MKTKVNIFWFRRDLRAEDNRGLYEALSSADKVQCIFIFDIHILKALEENDRRISLIYDTLLSLHKQWKSYDADLEIYHGEPLLVWKWLTENKNIGSVFFNHDFEPYPLQRDKQIVDFLQEKGIQAFSFKDHCIFEKNEIVKDDKTPYTVYTAYKNKWRKQVQTRDFKHYPSESLLGQLATSENSRAIPTLEALGFQRTPYSIPSIDPNKVILDYDKTRNYPAIQGTSFLSTALRFGLISIRQLMRDYFSNNEIFTNELIWREFYFMLMFFFPHSMENCFRKKYDALNWENNKEYFEHWCNGTTGIPIVDAGMRELKQTGWMHNRVRMLCASFLCKHLFIDWRWGEKYFAQHLLDFELSSNVGNWQWVAGTGADAAPYFRVFNPILQAQKYDPEQKYIRKWIPEYNTLDYPLPIINLEERKREVIEKFKIIQTH